MHVYNHILTFTKLTTYSALVVKSNFENFGGTNPFIPLWVPRVRPCLICLPFAGEWRLSMRQTLPVVIVNAVHNSLKFMFWVCEEAATAGCHGDSAWLAGGQWRRRLAKLQVLDHEVVSVDLSAVSRRSPARRTPTHSPVAEHENRTDTIHNRQQGKRRLYLSRAVHSRHPFRWLRSPAVENWSLADLLSLSCARLVADGWPLMWVSHPL